MPSETGETLDVVSPIDGNVTTIANANENDVNNAAGVARKSYDSGSWSNASPQERKRHFIILLISLRNMLLNWLY